MNMTMRSVRMKHKAISATCVSSLLFGTLLWAPSCSTPPLTEIIVNVDSTFAADELDMIRLVIVRNGESRAVTADLGEVALPFTQGVVHRGGSFDVSISAQGIFEERVLVEQLVPVERFIEGETLQVHVQLSPSCIGICEGRSCVNGTCVDNMADAGVIDVGAIDSGLVDAIADGTLDVPPPGECPEGPIDITGDYICAVDCPDCHLRCNSGDCQVTCRAGASCRVESNGHDIVADCQEGSDCSFRTTKSGGVSARCARANCDVDCGGDEACDINCPQGECFVDCNRSTMCRLRGCPSETCGRDGLVCGRDCP